MRHAPDSVYSYQRLDNTDVASFVRDFEQTPGAERPFRSLGRSARQLFSFRRLMGRYDAATTSADNHRHWAAADGMSANAANRAEVRRTLRNRSRYEIANNSYARGITLTLANDVVGTGLRLQMLTPKAAVNHFVEREFFHWADEVGLAEKLRTMRLARASEGESFGMLSSNPRIESPPSQLPLGKLTARPTWLYWALTHLRKGTAFSNRPEAVHHCIGAVAGFTQTRLGHLGHFSLRRFRDVGAAGEFDDVAEGFMPL